MRSRLVSLLLVSVALSGATRTASAEWPPCGRAISAAANTQTHASSTTDGADGAIVTWQDSRLPRINIFAQHVLASGEVDGAWPVDGRALLNDPAAIANAAGGQFSPVIVSDGAGGAIVVWTDLRDSTTDFDIFAQHILATGVVDGAWPANGLPLVKAAGTQNLEAVVADGTGGAIVTWVDGRVAAFQPDIYAQHVLPSGVVDPAWPANGLVVCDAQGLQSFPAIVEDGAGGAIITWQDERPGPNGIDVFAQHVLHAGVVDPAWPVNGRDVVAMAGAQGRPTITSDGAHGAIVAWGDARVFDTNHIFAQHVLGSGAIDPAWPADGLSVSDAGFLESRALAVPDGGGGAIVTWQALDVHLNMYAQHVKAAGVVDPAWPAGGRALSITSRQESHASIVPDGTGGAVIAWEDTFDIVAQHVLATGALDAAYPDTGRAICNLPSQQGGPVLVATSGGGAIVAWSDTRSGNGPDIFAMQVLEATTVDTPGRGPRPFSFAGAIPNPARAAFTLHFALPREGHVRLAIFDAGGRRVRELISGPRPEGEQTITWDRRDDSGHAVRAGFYFVRLEAEGRALTRKLVTLE